MGAPDSFSLTNAALQGMRSRHTVKLQEFKPHLLCNKSAPAVRWWVYFADESNDIYLVKARFVMAHVSEARHERYQQAA